MVGPKPLLLLDVDGVLNPYAAERCPEGYREYHFFPDEELVRLAEVHGEWLRGVADQFDLVWATGWGNEADRLIAPILGLPRYPAIAFPPGPFDPAEKIRTVRSLADDRPLAWVDDVITPEAQRWAAERAAPTLLVDVDPAIGLTEGIIADLKAWAAALSRAARVAPGRS